MGVEQARLKHNGAALFGRGGWGDQQQALHWGLLQFSECRAVTLALATKKVGPHEPHITKVESSTGSAGYVQQSQRPPSILALDFFSLRKGRRHLGEELGKQAKLESRRVGQLAVLQSLLMLNLRQREKLSRTF